MKRRFKDGQLDPVAAEVAGLVNPFDPVPAQVADPGVQVPAQVVEQGGPVRLPRKEAKRIVLDCALGCVQKYLGEFGAEGADGDISLGDIFDKAKRDNSRTWLVEGRLLNRTQIQCMLVNLVAEGELLPALCKVEGMPSLLTVNGWREDFIDFETWMRRAEMAQAGLFMAETIAIADGAIPATSFVAKIQMDQRSKMAAFLDPKKWSPKQVVDVTLHDETSDAQIQARVRSLLLSNMDRYRELFGIIMVREEDFAKLVLEEKDKLLAKGVEVLKTADYKDKTFSMDMFKVNERVERKNDDHQDFG